MRIFVKVWSISEYIFPIMAFLPKHFFWFRALQDTDIILFHQEKKQLIEDGD